MNGRRGKRNVEGQEEVKSEKVRRNSKREAGKSESKAMGGL